MTSVLIHKYSGRLTALEYNKESVKPKNFLVFIAGLTDGFLASPYVKPLSEALVKKFNNDWVVVEAMISSSYDGFGTGSLKRDVKELSELVKFLRSERGSKDSKVVLMGHSTGCQDTMEYLTKYSYSEDFEPICSLDAGILQAPVSDTEAFEAFDADVKNKDVLARSEKLVKEGKGDQLLSSDDINASFGIPMTAYRFHSLAGRRTDDDYFSSYLTDDDFKSTFGKVNKPFLIFDGEKDEFVPPHVNRKELVEAWRRNTDPKFWSHLSGTLKNASHKVDLPDAIESLVQTVVTFIDETF